MFIIKTTSTLKRSTKGPGPLASRPADLDVVRVLRSPVRVLLQWYSGRKVQNLGTASTNLGTASTNLGTASTNLGTASGNLGTAPPPPPPKKNLGTAALKTSARQAKPPARL